MKIIPGERQKFFEFFRGQMCSPNIISFRATRGQLYLRVFRNTTRKNIVTTGSLSAHVLNLIHWYPSYHRHGQHTLKSPKLSEIDIPDTRSRWLSFPYEVTRLKVQYW